MNVGEIDRKLAKMMHERPAVFFAFAVLIGAAVAAVVALLAAIFLR